MTGKQPSRLSDHNRNDERDGEATVNTGEQNEDWVASSLKQLYRSTVEEGIPDDMLALLDALDDEEDDHDASKEDKKSSKTTGGAK